MADSRTLSECPNCGHWDHPVGNDGSCDVIWMGERCGCRTRHPAAPGIVGVAEIAKRAGVAAATVHSWRQRHADFPAPAVVLARGPVWFWDDVEAWTRTLRQGRPRKG